MASGFPYLQHENSPFAGGRNGSERLQDESAYYPHYPTRTAEYQAPFGSNASVNEPSSPSQTFHGVNVEQHLAHDAQGKRAEMYYAHDDYAQSRFAAFPHATTQSGLTRIQTDHFEEVPRQGFAAGIVSATSSSSSQSPERGLADKSPSSASATASTSISPSAYNRPRSEKVRIQLAPDQPLTTHGKVRTRVYVACIQWLVIHNVATSNL